MIDVIAVWGLFVLAAAVVGVWLTLPTRAKVQLALSAVVAAAVVVVGVKLAGTVWSDPRPFIVDPSITPTIAHATDNGFVSDHATAAAMLAGLVLPWRRRLGVAMAFGALAIGWARIVAGVHHWPDVLGGLAIGLACAALGSAVGKLVAAKTWGRRAEAPPREPR